MSLKFPHQFHPHLKDHGPFDFYLCRNCGSGITFPLPDSEQLARLYHSFDEGVEAGLRESRRRNPLTAWYEQCLERGMKMTGHAYSSRDRFTWVDVGAGAGEFSALLSKRFPSSSGLAIDFHDRPPLLSGLGNIAWKKADLNEPDFSSAMMPEKADLVFALAVLEHVQYPNEFARELIRLAKPGTGSVYVVAPDFASRARKLMGKKWPFFLPGEHLNIPSREGARIIFHDALRKLADRTENRSAFSHSISLPYPLRYTLDYLGLGGIGRFFPKSSRFPLWAGVLESGIAGKLTLA